MTHLFFWFSIIKKKAIWTQKTFDHFFGHFIKGRVFQERRKIPLTISN